MGKLSDYLITVGFVGMVLGIAGIGYFSSSLTRETSPEVVRVGKLERRIEYMKGKMPLTYENSEFMTELKDSEEEYRNLVSRNSVSGELKRKDFAGFMGSAGLALILSGSLTCGLAVKRYKYEKQELNKKGKESEVASRGEGRYWKAGGE